MSTTRIPIDGLWRCLCPTLDAIATARHTRIVPYPRFVPSDNRPRTNCPRAHPFHSATQTRTRTLRNKNSAKTSYVISLDREQSSCTPKHAPILASSASSPRLGIPPTRWRNSPLSSVKSEFQHDLLDSMSIPRIHDLLRKTRAERKSFAKVVELVWYLVSERGEKPGLIHYDSLIRANASAMQGSADAVRTLLEEMKEFSIGPDSGLYHGALQVLAIHPDYVLRTEIMQEMKERWIGLSPEGWHSLVVGLIRDRQYEVAMDKLDEMHSDRITVQPWLYDIFMFQLCEAGELDEVFNLLKYRFENSRNEILPTVWYYLMDAFSSAFHYDGVKYIWNRRVQNESLVLSDGMCIAVLNCAARYCDPELATDTIRILSGRRSALTTFHYEPLLAAYSGSGDLKTALRVLVIMAKAGIEPDTSTTRSLYVTLSKYRDLAEKAWQDLEELAHDGHKIPVAAANVIIEAHIEIGQFETAVKLYKSLHTICESGPNTDTFNVLLQGAARQERKDLSVFLASEMRALGIKPDMLTYDRLILACLYKQADYEDAFKYLEEMVEVGANKPDGGWWMRGGTATLLIKRCVEERDPRAWNLLDEMEKRKTDSFKLNDWVQQNWKGPAVERRTVGLNPQGKKTAWSTM